MNSSVVALHQHDFLTLISYPSLTLPFDSSNYFIRCVEELGVKKKTKKTVSAHYF